MGGFGSTRWGSHSKRTAVEEGLTLDLASMARAGCFVPWYSGRTTWSRGERQTASIGYTVRPEGEGLLLLLRHTWTPWGAEEAREVELPVRLEQQPMRFGRVRWWGRCPLMMNGRPCNRRIGKLYSPPGSAYFGCRVCHGLTYASAQEHDKRVSALRRDSEALDHILSDLRNASPRNLLLALKATAPRRR
jgi:hypothetical protein